MEQVGMSVGAVFTRALMIVAPRPFTTPITPTGSYTYSPSSASAIPMLRLNTTAAGARHVSDCEYFQDWAARRMLT
jgi:hypothetical protein